MNQKLFDTFKETADRIAFLDRGKGISAPDVQSAIEFVRGSVIDLQGANVRNYGAIGDGLNDDLMAIQNAINSVKGTNTRLVIPEGQYLISNSLIIDDSLILEFLPGSVIIPSANFEGDQAIKITASNVVISNLSIKGDNLPVETRPFDGSYDPIGVGLLILGNDESPLENISISGGAINNTPFSAIYANYTNNLKIKGVVLKNCSNNTAAESPAAIRVGHSSNVVISEITNIKPGMKGITLSHVVDGIVQGCYTEGVNEGHSGIYFTNSQRCSAINNHQIGGFAFKASRFNRDITVSNNHFSDCYGGIFVQGSSFVNVIDNTVRNAYRFGIQVEPHPTYDAPCDNIRIAGNFILRDDDFESPEPTVEGIVLSGRPNLSLTNIFVESNTIVNARNYGIRTRTNPTDNVFDMITVCKNKIVGGANGIWINVSNVIVEGNTIENIDGGDSIRITASSDAISNGGYVKVLHNQILNHMGNGMSIIISNVDVDSVILEGNQIIDASNGILVSNTSIINAWIEKNRVISDSNIGIYFHPSEGSETVLHINYNVTNKRISFDNADLVTGSEQFNRYSSIVNRPPGMLPPTD